MSHRRPLEWKECDCGCGRMLLAWNHGRALRFIKGHNNRGRRVPTDVIKRRSASLKKRYAESPDLRAERSRAARAQVERAAAAGEKWGFEAGEANPNWRGGRCINSKGYRITYIPGHHLANAEGWVPEHRLIMERTLGRPLSSSEIVHHIDGDKLNNEIDNLMLCTSHQEHTSIHMSQRKSGVK